jgi:hypothetical protein
MDLTNEMLLELVHHSFIRMDGAWFMAVAKKYGVQVAWEMDVEAWRQVSYIAGKNIRNRFITDPVWPDSFVEAIGIFYKIFNKKGCSVTRDGDALVVRVTDCDTQKAIAKAGIADCGIATIESYRGVARGLFGKDADISVEHTKNLNHGDDCCEVVINLTTSKVAQSG